MWVYEIEMDCFAFDDDIFFVNKKIFKLFHVIIVFVVVVVVA